jgi:alpha-tubulin suppressor-like RCC1 family protein
VKCWGYNAYGRLGLGDTIPRGNNSADMGNNLPKVDLGTGTIVLALAAGFGHTCALLDGGSVKCWGENGSGQLGLGDITPRGDNSGEMGDSLPAVNLGDGAITVALAAGIFHTCGLLNDGSVKCWGGNGDGVLGLGDMISRGDQANEMGDNLPTVKLFSDVW